MSDFAAASLASDFASKVSILCSPAAAGSPLSPRSKKSTQYLKKRLRAKLESKLQHKAANFLRGGGSSSSIVRCNCGIGTCNFEYSLSNKLVADIGETPSTETSANVTVRLQDCSHGTAVSSKSGLISRPSFAVCNTCLGSVVDNLSCVPRDAIAVALASTVSNFPDAFNYVWEYKLFEVNKVPSLWTLTLRGMPAEAFEQDRIEVLVDGLSKSLEIYWEDFSNLMKEALVVAINLVGSDRFLGQPFRVETRNFDTSKVSRAFAKQIIFTTMVVVPIEYVAQHKHKEHDDPSKVQYQIGVKVVGEDGDVNMSFSCVKDEDVVYEEKGEEGEVRGYVDGIPLCLIKVRISSLMKFVESVVAASILGAAKLILATKRIEAEEGRTTTPAPPAAAEPSATVATLLSPSAAADMLLKRLCQEVFKLEVRNFLLIEGGMREVFINTAVTVPPEYKDHDHKKGHNDPTIPFFLRVDELEFTSDPETGELSVGTLVIMCVGGAGGEDD